MHRDLFNLPMTIVSQQMFIDITHVSWEMSIRLYRFQVVMRIFDKVEHFYKSYVDAANRCDRSHNVDGSTSHFSNSQTVFDLE